MTGGHCLRAARWTVGVCLAAGVLWAPSASGRSVANPAWASPDRVQGRGVAGAVVVRVMSFNIRYGTADDGEDAWPNRSALVGEVIATFGPTVLGVQEALAFQLRELDRMLPGYGRVGVGRDDAKEEGEFSAIYYDRSRLEVVDQGTFWFSETPGVPGSMAWGATIPRICTWALFRDVASGRTFHVFNNHWDHQSQESRERSAALLLGRIAERSPAGAVIVTGDFNAGEDNAAFAMLTGDSTVRLGDTFRVLHPSVREVGTFNGFDGVTDGPKIDAVLASRHWLVVSSDIVRANAGGRYPSDHFPVTAVLRLRDGVRPPQATSLPVGEPDVSRQTNGELRVNVLTAAIRPRRRLRAVPR